MKKIKWLLLCVVPMAVYSFLWFPFYLLIDRLAALLLFLGQSGGAIWSAGNWLYINTYWLTIVTGFFGIFAAGMFCYRRLNRDTPSFSRFRFTPATLLVLIPLALLTQYTVSLLLNVILPLFPHVMHNYEQVMDNLGLTAPSALDLLYGILLAPVLEEIMMRGITLSMAKKAVPFWAANLIQALLFGILHMNLVQGCYATVLGLMLGYLVQRYRTLAPSCLVHICINLAGFFLVPGNPWLLIFCFIASAAALAAALRHQKQYDPEQYLFTRFAPW